MHRDSSTLKYSYIVVRKGKQDAKRRSTYRALSPMLKHEKGGHFVVLCSDFDTFLVHSPKGDKETKSKIKSITRGDLVRLKDVAQPTEQPSDQHSREILLDQHSIVEIL
ncbi:MAG: hypothetical protein R3A11_06400 [Bdellovibrionota bacterium]